MVDAYQDITIPFQMSSAEFFDLVRSHLNPGGVMVVNMNMISDGRRSINEALTDTISSVFGSDAVRTADVPGTTNRELFARNAGGSGDKAGLSDPAALESAAYDRTHSHELASTMADVAGRMQAVDDPAERADATILTDDKAPVEVLGMRAIDNIIAEEAGPYRELLKTEGIAGLLKAVQ